MVVRLVLALLLLVGCSSAASADGSAPSVTLPPLAGVVDYQLGGAYTPASDVQVVTRDRTEKPAPGVYDVCYVNAFQTQPGELGWWNEHHPTSLLRTKAGALVHDPGWPDEVLLDLRTAKRRATAATVVGRWFAGCAKAGYQAVEPDNLDSWTRSRTLLTRAEAVAYARLLVKAAHASGLAIAQKNAPQLATTAIGFDFAVAEECQVYSECAAYTKAYGAHVIEIEYTDNGRKAYRTACAARSGQISILLRDRDVTPVGSKAYVYQHC